MFLKLNQLHTVLIGAGPVGLEKLSAILAQSEEARITIIAEQVCDGGAELAAGLPQIMLYKKSYEAADLVHADLVIAATNNKQATDTFELLCHSQDLALSKKGLVWAEDP